MFKNTTKTNADHLKSAIRRNTKESWTDAYSAILNRSGKKFRRVYRDVSDKSAFHEWMYMMHSEKFSSLIDHEFGHFQAKKKHKFLYVSFSKNVLHF